MVLIGMLDSPYVRRVAVSLRLMGMPFEHQPVSVFRHYDRFRAINPVVKAPSLVCDDGTVLMDSTLILDYIETIAPPSKRLMPAEARARQEALRLTGLALAACEKCVQIVYEKEQRPEDKRHGPWLDRVTGQANAAFGELEKSAARAKPWLQGGELNAADVIVACAWRFGQFYDSAEVPASRYPALVAYSAHAEALPEFASTPLD
ncbi:MAG TPA: glutathione S-transferase N-terminal domain-containing protein [Usitatibacter sp.]|nr:glutathione S-transferase N-terminal domain-containing protein [Usitatibacter sp.]